MIVPTLAVMNLWLRLIALYVRVPFRSELSLWDTSVSRFRVWPSDLDPLMHMNNAKYLAIMDLARMDLMMRSGAWRALKRAKWYPVVAGQTISYFSSLNPWQRFEIHTRILGLDDRWGFIEQRFMQADKLVARAIVRTRFLKKSGGSVSHDELATVFGDLSQGPGIPEWVVEWAEHARPTSN